MNKAKKYEALTESEKFIFDLGSVADKLDSSLLDEGGADKRKILRLAGKIVADMATGGGEVDFSKVDFGKFISEFKRLKIHLA